MVLRQMEETGEVHVSTDVFGVSTIHYNRLNSLMNNNIESKIGKSSGLPKLRLKKNV